MTITLPHPVERLIDRLGSCPGVRAVTLGGSQASGTADVGSDWDLGVFYRSSIDLADIDTFGTIDPPGSWGRFMNGGAWLVVDGIEIDVILRDLDTVETWADRARRGEYEVDFLLGYLAGFPSYTLIAEVALSQVMFGSIDLDISYPPALASEASRRWEFQRDFTLDYASMHARRGDVLATWGNIARACLEEAHRRLCVRHEWVLNEKRLLAKAGLAHIGPPQRLDPADEDLVAAVNRCSNLLRS